MGKGSIFIVSGPSGVGKGTVVKKAIERCDNVFLSVSCTTRAPREGEIDGVQYYFISKEEFEGRIKNNYFIEYERYVDNYYGTPALPVLKAIEEGKNVILEIEVGGARQAKKRYEDAVLVFVAPPSNEELKRRLLKRDEGNEVALAAVDKRIERAKEEYNFIEGYDYIIINDDVDLCTDRLLSIIKAENLRVRSNKKLIEKLHEL
ncbi:MAG: guanylate kinase [Bacillota bacterium]|nr:guanylate kinase [Bacillota bacterium]